MIVSVDQYVYEIKYKNVPKKYDVFFRKNCKNMLIDEIKFWSKNKEDVEAYIAGKKYNL